MRSSQRVYATLATGFALALSLDRAEAQDELPADQARGLVDPHPVEPVDAALLVPRVVLGFPRLAFDLVNLPIVATLRFVEKHHVIEWTRNLLYNDARTAAIPSNGI